MTGHDIVTALEGLINTHEASELVRMDNGTEMTSDVVADCCRFGTTGIDFIDSASIWHFYLSGSLQETYSRFTVRQLGPYRIPKYYV